MARARTALAAAAALLWAGAAGASPAGPDPFAWAEEAQGAEALARTTAWTSATRARLEATPGFAATRARAAALLNDPRQIAYGRIEGGLVTNVWQDAGAPRGRWRAAPLEAYLADAARWRTLLDLDALARAEGRAWVWRGATCRPPDHGRCLVALSDGGRDAVELREVDLAQGRFVEAGFRLREAKQQAVWLDDDTILLQSDFGPGTLTAAGYGRQVRRVARGQDPASAPVLLEGAPGDVGVSPLAFHDGRRAWPMLRRATGFWSARLFHLAPDGRLLASPLPDHAAPEAVVDGWLVARLGDDWTADGTTHPAGALVALSLPALEAGQPLRVERVLTPTARQAVQQVASLGDALLVSLLDDMSGRLLRLRRVPTGWARAEVPVPAVAALQIVTASADRGLALVNVETLTTPDMLLAVGPDGPPVTVAAMPPQFDPATMTVERRFARSRDGTRVPLFLVRPAGVSGPLPTVIHAYGGFRSPQLPAYLGPLAQFWIEAGGAWAIAGIRGGGEYGPAWHAAARRAGRQRSLDDLHAVAETLRRDGLASAVALSGRSHGGLVAAAAITQRPDLYAGALVGAPLADMRHYHRWLAGASWLDEYGNPDDPAEWAWIRRFSPLDNLRAGVSYPEMLIHTATSDDRVHPAHARKLAARLEALGQPFAYLETEEGGHAGAPHRQAEAERVALLHAWLMDRLGLPPVSDAALRAGGAAALASAPE